MLSLAPGDPENIVPLLLMSSDALVPPADVVGLMILWLEGDLQEGSCILAGDE